MMKRSKNKSFQLRLRVRALLSKSTFTAIELSEEIGCSLNTAYRAINDLKASGVKVVKIRVQDNNRPGPAAHAYAIHQ